jgi:hypothetical protein
MIKFLSICQNTVTQTLRQPIYVILLLATFGVLILQLPLSGWTIGITGGNYKLSDQIQLENMGLSVLLTSGLLLAAFTASTAMGRELADQTVLTSLSKPVGRAVFVLGKFAGVALAVAIAYYLATLAMLLVVRHGVMSSAAERVDVPVVALGAGAAGLAILVAGLGNYFFAWPFTSALTWCLVVLLTAATAVVGAVGKGWTRIEYGEGIRPELLPALAMNFMAVMIFVATAVAASTRLAQVPTLLVCAAVFTLGSFHPFLFEHTARELVVLRVLGWLVPNLTYFYAMDTLASPTAAQIPFSLVALAGLYCLLYCGALLAVAVALFEHRSLEPQRMSGSLPASVGLLAWGGRLAAVGVGLWALVSLSLPDSYTAAGLGTIAGGLAAAVGGWLLWGYFARGVRWSWQLTTALAALAAAVPGIFAAVRLLAPDGENEPTGAALLAVAAAVVLVLLLLPQTRRHFRSEASL